MIPGQTCRTCVFCRQNSVARAECRRHPPLQDSNGPYFPDTDPDFWCGEWEEQPETQETWELTEAGAELVAKLQRGEKLTTEETAQMDQIADLYAGDVPKT